MKKALSALLMLALLLSAAYAETAAPERVAVLFSSYAEMWLEAGGSIYVTVGESVERGFAPEGTYLVDEGAGKAINTELLLSYAPDLIICSADIPAQAEAAATAGKAGIKTLCLTVETFEDYAAAFALLTEVTGNVAAYDKCVTESRAAIEKTVAENRAEGVTYAFIRTGSSASSTKIKQSAEHFACDIINAFGLQNIADAGSAASGAVNIEALIAADPDRIFFSLMGDAEVAEAHVNELLAQPEWQCLRAVRENHAVILPKSLFHFKPNSAWPQAYACIAELISK